MKYLNFPLRKTYSRLGDLSFSMAAARVWNSLPIFIRKATNVHNFTSQLKTYYFKFAYYKPILISIFLAHSN